MRIRINTNRLMRRLGILTILLLCAMSINANPLMGVFGGATAGLDLIYVIAGLIGIWLLLFMPRRVERDVKGVVIPSGSSTENLHTRKVIRKTS